MDATATRPGWQSFPALKRSFRFGDPARALREAHDRDAPAPPKTDRGHPIATLALESLTESFRVTLARRHVARVREERARYRAALGAWQASIAGEEERRRVALERDGEIIDDPHPAACPATLAELREAVTTARWHEGRERGQRTRFERVRSCGVRMMIARCNTCGEDAKAVPEGCGVRRVCDRCDVIGAAKRRARFGRARGRAFIDAHRYGLTRRVRKGGRYTEKMLTLTVPHETLATATGAIKDDARDEVHARILAAFEAWPRFLRKWNRHFRLRRESHVVVHRSFEWTPGRDGLGHPHFHVYVHSPFVFEALCREWWAEALREVGWKVDRYKESGESRVVVQLQMLRGVSVGWVRELMKGGRRAALTLSRISLTNGPGIDAFDYAEGWTIGDVAERLTPPELAKLYMALEGRRLTQASRGFFEDDPKAECACCGGSQFRLRFEPAPELAPVVVRDGDGPTAVHERGPP